MNNKKREKEEKVGEKRAEKEEKCGVCKSTVEDVEKGVQCELCESWFHCKCEGLQDDTYRLMKQDKIHFYCGRCDKAAGRLLKNVSNLMKRQDKLEDEIKKNNENIRILTDTFSEEAKTQAEKLKKLDKTAEDMKKETARISQELEKSIEDLKKNLMKIKVEHQSEFKKLNEEMIDVKKVQEEMNFEKQIEQLTQAFVKDTQWSDIVKKEVDSKIENVSAELSTIQKMVDITKGLAEEEKEKEARSKNIIIYRVPESQETSFEGRQKQDKEVVLDLLRELIDKDFEESEIQKTFRLGKITGYHQNRHRPILVQFVNKMTKNYLMNNLYYIRKTSYKDVVISHDMTLKERDQCKQLVEEAKKKELEEQSWEWIFRVRGLPGQMKVMKI